MNKTHSVLVLVVVGFGALGSCVVDRRGPSSSGQAARGGTMSTADATDMLSQARCDYEVKCNRVGPTATYASREHCIDVNRNDSASKFADCKYEVKRADMQKCADEIRNEDCGGAGRVVDVFEHAAACRTGKLCLD